MLRFLSDEDFDGRIIRGLRHRRKDIDLVRAQDVGLPGASDEKLLEWAAENGRILLSHDKRTMPIHVRERVADGQSVPGIFIVLSPSSIGRCIDDIELLVECSDASEWQNTITYLPFK